MSKIILKNQKQYERILIKTHVIKREDEILDVIEKYVSPLLQNGDQIYICEKIISIMTNRAIKISDIKPSWWATKLSKYVTKTPHGIGVGMPETMELAIREVGLLRILFAASLSAISKPLGIKGVFYNIAGSKVRGIDGPCDYTIPPYNNYAILIPENSNVISENICKKIGYPVVIVDANDLGVNILGRSDKNIDLENCAAIISDNPFGQSDEQTPIAIIREVN